MNPARLEPYLRELNDDIVANRLEQTSNDDENPSAEDLQGDKATSSMKILSKMLPNTMHHVIKLHDSSTQDFTTDENRIADFLAEAAVQRQSHFRGNDAAGHSLLDAARLDLTSVDTNLGPCDVVNAIRDGNS